MRFPFCRRAASLFLLTTIVSGSAAAEAPASRQLLLRALPAHVQEIAGQHGLTVRGESSDADGHLALVEAPEAATIGEIASLLASDPRVEDVDPALLASLPSLGHATAAAPDTAEVAADLRKAGTLSTSCLDEGFAEAPWSGYADQEAARLVYLHEAQLLAPDCGAVTVAILDTGVDPDHPALAGALVPGYDFLLDEPGLPSEWDFLDQSIQPILEQSIQPILEQSIQPILEQSIQPILEGFGDSVILGQGEAVLLDASMAPVVDSAEAPELQALELPPYFGHGTMVAGLVRLAAPGAEIMPLRVFTGSGRAHLFQIVRAVYWAVDHGADVINMSFSMSEKSQELQKAIQYARSRGVVCVAAAGNQGEATQVYPAKLAAATGVAATTLDDGLSEFSNHGSGLVDLGAPGSGVVSTFPGGLYAAGWGTSFSAPLVAGSVALIRPLHPDGDGAAAQETVHDLKSGSAAIEDLAGVLGSGRLDALGTVLAAAD